MIKKVFATIMMIGVLSAPLSAQSVQFEFSYQSFRPFIHFQLNLSNSYSYYQNPYDAAYLKGYMDGVNDAYYHDYRFYDMVHDIDIYEAGYRDGYRDRDLMIRLRGNDWYYRNRFVYDDYHSPYYSVQVWLGGLSLAFLQVPERRLPRHWKRHAHPVFVDYRHWHAHPNRYKGPKYRHFVHIEKNYVVQVNQYRNDARREQNRYQNQRNRNGYRTGRIERYSKIDKRQARQRVRQQPKVERNRSRTVQNSRRDRAIGNTTNTTVKESPRKRIKIQSRSRSSSRIDRNRDGRGNRNKQIKKNTQRKRTEIRSNNRNGKNSQRSIRKETNRNKSRGSVKKDRDEKRSKGRKNRKSRGNNKRGN